MKNAVRGIVFLIVLSIVFAGFLWQCKSLEIATHKEETMCMDGAEAALLHFNEYQKSGKDSEYVAAVAEFRTFMTAYLCLGDKTDDEKYMLCAVLYEQMINNPDHIKTRIPELNVALDYLSEDYESEEGFGIIESLSLSVMSE